MKNINAYCEDEFYSSFLENPIYAEIQKDYDKVFWGKNRTDWKLWDMTPRELLGGIRSTEFDMTSLYYMSFLLEKNPDIIYDLGCGWNIFKKYIRKIHGIDACSLSADSREIIDDKWLFDRKGTLDSVMSICALHSIPLELIKKRVIDFASLLQTGGRGYLSLNLQRMIERSTVDEFKNVDFDFDEYVRNELEDIPFKYLVFDVDFSYGKDTGIDGNIRLVIEN